MNKKIKKTLTFAAGAATAVVTVVGAYVFFNKPSEVQCPCLRSTHRADGLPKKAFDSAREANFQSFKQFILHGEFCNPYKVGDKYYTGHSKDAPFKNIHDILK